MRRGNFFRERGVSLFTITGILYGHLCKNGCTDRDAVWVVGSHWPKESCVNRGPQKLRDFAMATNFGTKIAITGFM